MELKNIEPAEVKFILSILRKETGKIETFNLVGIVSKTDTDNSNKILENSTWQ